MQEDWRYERKFHSSLMERSEVIQMIKLHPYGFKEVYPERIINNIYYDTPSLNSYHEHIAGSFEREKVRIRWYGEDKHNVIPIFEIKRKAGLLNRKDKVELLAISYDEWEKSHFELMALDLPDHVNLLCKHLQPLIYNSYRRKYFESFDRKFRLTVDSELIFKELGKERISKSPEIILELKYPVSEDGSAEAIGTKLPFRVSKFSKYIEALDQLQLLY